MKNIITFIASVSILSFITFTGTSSFAKHGKKSAGQYTSSYDGYSNSYGNSESGNWKFGAELGMTLELRSTTITGTTDPTIQMLSSMSGFTPFFTVYADYSISDRFGVQAKIGYDNVSISASQTISTQGAQVDVTRNAHTGSISIGALVRYDVSKNIFITAGPRFNVALGNTTIVLDEKILTPGKVFDDGSQQLHEESEAVHSTKSSFGLEIGAGYRIRVAENIDLVPKANFQLFPSVGSETDIAGGGHASTGTATRFQISCGLLMGI